MSDYTRVKYVLWYREHADELPSRGLAVTEDDELVGYMPEKTCEMKDCGDYQPNHEFKRVACTACGAMHWEHPNMLLPRMKYCPWCGAEVTGWRGCE